MRTVVVIPARLASTRLPRKVLLPIQGRPMLWHVWRRARGCSAVDAVYIATDSDEVRLAAEAWGGNVLMTSADCVSGTHRTASTVPLLGADLVVNVQADEPLLEAHSLERLVSAWCARPCDIITLVFRIREPDALADPNVVKVVRGGDGRALYFSRSVIPHVRGGCEPGRWLQQHDFWGHIGVYGYRPQILARLPELATCDLEEAEKLEQLRWLSAGLNIFTIEVDAATIAVDTESDLRRVRQRIEGPIDALRIAHGGPADD
jgi:3-deoxy-manno-octulosonate cytidylyltransferase (CMP-KDO synthetase)